MPNQETVYQVADRIATIALNRPDKGKPETFNFLGFTHLCEEEEQWAVRGVAHTQKVADEN